MSCLIPISGTNDKICQILPIMLLIKEPNSFDILPAASFTSSSESFLSRIPAAIFVITETAKSGIEQ